ncbi:MAG: tetratricopeptide repeat protein, partial [Candidatus Aminicenantaceae bacterium]
YKKSLNSGDQDSVTHYNYGASLINLGKKEEARSIFETLIDQDPDYSDAYYQLGIIYLSAGEIDRAIELLETFIAKDPENNKAPQTREILKTLKKKRSVAD